MGSVVKRLDEYQRAHLWLGFPLAVAKKFGEDKAGHLAALVSYYAFFSLFPLLMVFTAVLGMLLRGNPELQDAIVDSALTQFPVIGDQIRENVGSLKGSPVVLAVGIATALWAGMGVTTALQSALNSVWDVPIRRQPNFLFARLRSLIMLAVLGILTVGAALLSGLGGGPGAVEIGLRVVGIAGGIAVNLVLFMLAFKILTNRRLTWWEVFPGAAVAAGGWALLQILGTWFVDRQLKGATETYGAFAFVIGLLLWLYIGAQLTLYAAEVNAVKANHLWPRGLRKEPMTEADRRTLRRMAKVEERREDEDVDVSFDGRADPNGDGATDEGSTGSTDDPQAAVRRARDALEEAREAVAEARHAVEESSEDR
jgi:YihY family inner membrane protein